MPIVCGVDICSGQSCSGCEFFGKVERISSSALGVMDSGFTMRRRLGAFTVLGIKHKLGSPCWCSLHTVLYSELFFRMFLGLVGRFCEPSSVGLPGSLDGRPYKRSIPSIPRDNSEFFEHGPFPQLGVLVAIEEMT